jgi:hypothetical protein
MPVQPVAESEAYPAFSIISFPQPFRSVTIKRMSHQEQRSEYFVA